MPPRPISKLEVPSAYLQVYAKYILYINCIFLHTLHILHIFFYISSIYHHQVLHICKTVSNADSSLSVSNADSSLSVSNAEFSFETDSGFERGISF